MAAVAATLGGAEACMSACSSQRAGLSLAAPVHASRALVSRPRVAGQRHAAAPRLRAPSSCRQAARVPRCSAGASTPKCQDTPAAQRLQALAPAMRRVALALAVAAAAIALQPLPALAEAAAGAVQQGGVSSALKGMLSFVLHLDKHMAAMIAQHGTATYAILFGIVFAETGLVLTPFLPGDSLLFAAGAFAATGLLRLPLLCATFIVAAVLGDAVNYAVGSFLGGRALRSKLINKEYIDKTQAFFAKYGGKTVVLARFVPIVRTFAPFVAGVGSMAYGQFAAYNVGGALLWTALFVGAGYLFGNLPVVQHNFTLVVLAIVVVSVVPVVLEILQAQREAAEKKAAQE